jgi:hypothetical protein
MAMPLPHWEEDTPENQARLRTLQAFIRYSSRYRMLCKVNMLQYYKQFLVLNKLMMITGVMTRTFYFLDYVLSTYAQLLTIRSDRWQSHD